MRVTDDAFDKGDVQLAVQQGFLDPAGLIHRHPDRGKAIQAAAAAQNGGEMKVGDSDAGADA